MGSNIHRGFGWTSHKRTPANGRQGSPSRKTYRRRPRFESFEDRRMLSVFVVDSTDDTVDNNPGNGIAEDNYGYTTLRAAVMEANALAGDDTIVLPPDTYELTRMGLWESSDSYGDLDIWSNITILGTDAATTIIDVSALHDRAFDVLLGSHTLTLEHLTITGGRVQGDSSHASEDQGGAIRMDSDASVLISDCILTGNSAPRTAPGFAYGFGGAIANKGYLAIYDSTLDGNSASNAGGSIYTGSTGAITIVYNTTFSDNASPAGGAIRNHAILCVNNSTFVGNQSVSAMIGSGAAIDNNGGGNATLINCTLSGNTGLSGGAISNVDTLTAISCTIANNSASFGGGIHSFGTTVLVDTIIADNTASVAGPDVYGAVNSLGYNLVGDTSDSSGFDVVLDLLDVDPLLDPLADNGGPTWTHALPSYSPAVNAADPATAMSIDQRGMSRSLDAGPDIGAYEYCAAAVTVVSTAVDHLDSDWSPGHLSLREALLCASLVPGNEIITFDPSLNHQEITLALGQLVIDSNVAIQGPGAELLTIDADEQSRVLWVEEGVTAAVSGLTLRDGLAQDLNQYNDLDSRGGGIYNVGTLFLNAVAVLDNAVLGSGSRGGGIASIGSLIATDSIISGNSADDGIAGGIYVNTGSLELTRSTVSGNSAKLLYGSVYCTSTATATITDSLISGNSSGIINLGSMTITGSTISDNVSTADTGGILNYGTMNLVHSAVVNNHAGTHFGGIYVSGGSLTMVNSLVAGNSAAQYVGGVYLASGSLTVVDSTIAGNSAGTQYGGIHQYTGSLTVQNSIVALNNAPAYPDFDGTLEPASGYNLIGVDPGFIRNPSPGADGLWGTEDDDFGNLRLRPNGAAINAGSNALVPGGVTTDLDGKQRIIYTTVDVGAYEFCMPGDADYSGTVDEGDAGVLADHWGMSDMAWGDGDFNNDGRVSAADAAILAANWGATWTLPGEEVAPPAAATPLVGPIPTTPARAARRRLEPAAVDEALAGGNDIRSSELDVMTQQQLAWSQVTSRREWRRKILDKVTPRINLIWPK